MIFVFLLLWCLGAAAALLYFSAFRPLIGMLPHQLLRLPVAAVLMVGLWVVLVMGTILFMKGSDLQYTTPVGIVGAGYWVTLIPLLIRDYRSNGRRRPSRINIEPPTFSSGARTVPFYENDASASPRRDHGHTESRPLSAAAGSAISAVSLKQAAPLLYVGLGIIIGVLIAQFGWMSNRYSSFEECFLAESKGRQEITFRVVTKFCRSKFPAAPAN